MSGTKRKYAELEEENKRLQKENISLIDRLANLELDLTERVNALENEKTTKSIQTIGDCYQ